MQTFSFAICIGIARFVNAYRRCTNLLDITSFKAIYFCHFPVILMSKCKFKFEDSLYKDINNLNFLIRILTIIAYQLKYFLFISNNYS